MGPSHPVDDRPTAENCALQAQGLARVHVPACQVLCCPLCNQKNTFECSAIIGVPTCSQSCSCEKHMVSLFDKQFTETHQSCVQKQAKGYSSVLFI